MNELINKITISDGTKYDCNFFVHPEKDEMIKNKFNELKNPNDKVKFLVYALFESELIYGFFLELEETFATITLTEKDNNFFVCLATSTEPNTVQFIIKAISNKEIDSSIEDIEKEIKKAKDLKKVNSEYNLNIFNEETKTDYKN